jgi:hypothetical protein
MTPDSWRFGSDRKTIQYKSAVGDWHFRAEQELGPDYSVKTTDCTPEISNRLRQRMFLQAIRSSLRNM